MGIFSGIGKAFDSGSAAYQKNAQQQQAQQEAQDEARQKIFGKQATAADGFNQGSGFFGQQNKPSQGLLGGSIGGGSIIQQNTNILSTVDTYDAFDVLGLKNKATGQQQKDFRKLEATLIKVCTEQCLRREMHFEAHSEFCMAKCYDMSYIYMRTGIAELTAFTYEHNIKS